MLVEVEFLRRAGAGEAAQAPQRDAHVAHAELDAVVEILELALVPHLHGAEVAVLVLADADAFRVVAIGAIGRGAGGADPLVAALVAALLLLEALLQVLPELFPAHGLDLLLLLVGEVALGELAQPFLGDLGLVDRLAHALDALEDMGENLVELVEMALVLHQAGAGEIVELLHALVGEILVESLQQGQVFPQGDRHLGRAQLCEEGEEHRASVCYAVRRSRGGGQGIDLRRLLRHR